MHILEQYAVNCGAKIGLPKIITQYFPLPFGNSKYICLNAGSGMESKNYDYYNEVIDFMLPFLEKENIKIVQVGAEKEKLINNCYSALGCTKRQTAHLIKNSELYLGSDTMSLHFASYFQKKIVCLSTVIYAENIYPYWSKKEDYKMIESHRNGNKPSFSSEEKPKTINLIKPEEASKEVLKFLKIKNNLDIQSLHLGEDFSNLKIELVPNFDFYVQQAPDKTLNLRLDLLNSNVIDGNNIKYILTNLSKRKCRIFSDKKFDVEFLKNIEIKKNLEEFTFYVKDSSESTKLFIKELIKLGLNCKFLFDESIMDNEKEINNLKLNLLDVCEVYKIEKRDTKEKQQELLKKIKGSSFYKSYRIIYSDGSTYISEAALKEKALTRSFYQDLKEIKNLDLLLQKDYDNIYIFKK